MADKIFKTLVHKPILWILVFAFLLRIWGITYGFPLFLVKDEPTLVYGALKMMELKSIIPVLHQEEFKKILYYPPFSSYFYVVVLFPFIGVHYLFSGMPALALYKDMLALDPSFIWITGRFFNALLGVATIFFVYLLAKKLFQSERSGIFAALFLSLSFYHIQLSHVIRHWMIATFFLYLLWLLALTIKERGKFSHYIASGIILGVASGGVNTASAIGIIPLLFGHFFSDERRTFLKRFFDKRLWIAFIISVALVALFIILYPYGFTRGEGAASPGADVVTRFDRLRHISIGGWINFLQFYLSLFLRYEFALFIAGFLGVVTLMIRKKWQWPLVSALYTAIYFTILYIFFNSIPRGIIFILPLMAVFAGYAVDVLLLYANKKKNEQSISMLKHSLYGLLLPSVLFISLFLWPFVTDLRYDWLMSQKDTRLVFSEWMRATIPENTKVLVDSEFLRFINTKEGIRALEKIDPSALRAVDQVLLREPAERYPHPAYNILNLHFITPSSSVRLVRDPAFFQKLGFRYVVVEYQYVDKRDLSPITRDIVQALPLVKQFNNNAPKSFIFSIDASGEMARTPLRDLFAIKRFGAIIDVYAL